MKKQNNQNTNIFNFSYFIEEYEEEIKLIKMMMGTFHHAFKVLYDYYKIPSINYISKLCKINHRTIASYYDGTSSEPHYKKVLAICAGLCLSPRVSEYLLSTIRVDLSISSNVQDHLYHKLLHVAYHEGLDKWNEYVKESHIGDEHLL